MQRIRKASALLSSVNILFAISSFWLITGFSIINSPKRHHHGLSTTKAKTTVTTLWAKGFGSSSASSSSPSANKKVKGDKKQRLINTLEDKEIVKNKSKKKQQKSESTIAAKPFVKSEQEQLLASLTAKASTTCIGHVVAEAMANGKEIDPFWELMPSLITSKFPHVRDDQLRRIAGFLEHTLNRNLPLEDEIIYNKYRPEKEIHAYMPGLGPTKPFYDPKELQLCQLLSDNYESIKSEYNALLNYLNDSPTKSKKYGFQSVTSLNYESGWKTLVLFYNGHRIAGFPYHVCPITTKILETVPIAGRIAGFNRQQPLTGIPLHTDGNNMWLTCQMGISVPEDQKAYIRVGNETRRWKEGECLLYDTTYEHETRNEHPTQERVVLHVDFFNTLTMTRTEIDIMQYIYDLREQFMKAEGVAKVDQQIL